MTCLVYCHCMICCPNTQCWMWQCFMPNKTSISLTEINWVIIELGICLLNFSILLKRHSKLLLGAELNQISKRSCLWLINCMKCWPFRLNEKGKLWILSFLRLYAVPLMKWLVLSHRSLPYFYSISIIAHFSYHLLVKYLHNMLERVMFLQCHDPCKENKKVYIHILFSLYLCINNFNIILFWWATS